MDIGNEFGWVDTYLPAHIIGIRLAIAAAGETGPAGESLPEPHLPGDKDCVRCAGSLPGSEVASRGSVARYAWDLFGAKVS